MDERDRASRARGWRGFTMTPCLRDLLLKDLSRWTDRGRDGLSVSVGRMVSEELGRSLTVQGAQFAWFLGAGASAAANIPTAEDMIVDFKARLFCAAVRVPRSEIDPTDPMWLERIESHFQGNNDLPGTGDPGEYAAAFEAAFPTEGERRSYIEEIVKRGSPSFGHRVLAALIASGQVPCLFTTNFDPLIERAAIVADDLLPPDQRVHLTVAALDSAERADRCLRESGWPLLVKLHGDYQSVRLKNTAGELQAQDGALRAVLVGACNRFGLIISGYSGRDTSVMAALREALAGPSPFPAGIRWVLRGNSSPLAAVVEFMEEAERADVDAKFVEAETFDELTADIDRQVTMPGALMAHVRDARPSPILQPVVLPTLDGSPFPVLRCSALPVLALPTGARRLSLSKAITTPEARALLKAARKPGVVAARGQAVVAFGVDEDLLTAFASYEATTDGEVALSPAIDSVDRGLLYDALTKALTRGRPLRPILRTTGHAIVVTDSHPSRTPEQKRKDQARLAPLKDAYSDALLGTVPGTALQFAEGIRIRLECHRDQWWCVFDPFTWVDRPRPEQHQSGARGSEHGPQSERRRSDATGEWRKERWARRYNPKWAAILDAWAGILVSGPEDTAHSIGLRDRPGIDALFTVSRTTAWSRPAGSAATGGIQ